MAKGKCCLKYEKKGTHCKGCPIVSLEEIFKGEKKKGKKKGKKKDKKKKGKKD